MTRRMYSLSDFLHTWVDLAGLRFVGFDPGKSIISPRYTTGPVLIGDPAKPDALADVRQKFFPAAATMMPVPAAFHPPEPAYRPGHGAVNGTVPVPDQRILHQ
jgi:hypothetical protein